MNIYAKLTILCVSLVVFTSSVLYIFSNRQIEKTFRQELFSNIARQSEETISTIERFMFSRLNDVRLASRNPYFRIADLSKQELTNRLEELENLNPLYYSFSFFNNERNRLADSKNLAVGVVHGRTGYWNLLSEQSPAVMDVSVSESVEKPVMHFAATVDDLFEEKPIGVLVGRILVDELYQILGDISLGADTARKLQVTLIDKDGTILYSNKKDIKPLVDKFPEDILSNAVRLNEHVSVKETDTELYFQADEKGYQTYLGNKWKLIISVSKEDAFLPLQEIQRDILWLILSVLGVSIVLALIVANLFVKPIVRLSAAAEEMGKGNLGIEVNIDSKDEIGKLAKQLTHASQTLRNQLNEEKIMNTQLEIQKNEIEVQKVQLENVNLQISDSIVYAQRIQKSILPELTVISKLVKNAFVFYQPKAVVSGDFYWFERVRQGRNEYLIIACADCTGHGVPGAIMSIMGSNQLTNIVYYQNYIDPNKILARLDKVIKFELQREVDNYNRDGMEIGICVINLDDLSMEFAGAGIPLYIVKKETTEIIKVRSPRLMIGGIEGDEKEASDLLGKEVLQLNPGDKIYMTSDGYQDQFGGGKDKKFLTKNFKELLTEVAQLPFGEQEDKLKNTFFEWKGDQPQTDDVVVIGVEI